MMEIFCDIFQVGLIGAKLTTKIQKSSKAKMNFRCTIKIAKAVFLTISIIIFSVFRFDFRFLDKKMKFYYSIDDQRD